MPEISEWFQKFDEPVPASSRFCYAPDQLKMNAQVGHQILCVLLGFIKLIYGLGFFSRESKRARTHDWESPRKLFLILSQAKKGCTRACRTKKGKYKKHLRDFKFCLTWYATSTTLCLGSGFIYAHVTKLEHLIKKFSRCLFFKKKMGFNCKLCLRSTSAALQIFPNEIARIAWKKKQTTEIWPILKTPRWKSLGKVIQNLSCY